jgi:LysM repeat protein
MKGRLLSTLVLAALLLGIFLMPGPTKADTCKQVYHVVKRGENLTQIALSYGVSVQSIVQANNLWNPNYIYTGQYLKIPVPCAPAPPTGCTTTHVVKRGEYLKVIAARYGTTIAAITNANHISNPNLIYPGQRLVIPVACKPTTPPATSTGPWKGQYWNNRFLQGGPQMVRQEKAVDFNWGVGSPGDGIYHDNFSARFTRTRKFNAGWFRFGVWTDDGVRMWIDGHLVLDQWKDQAPTYYKVDRWMSAGNHNLKIEYYENTGGAQIRLNIAKIGAPSGPTATPKPPDETGLWEGRYCSTRIIEECCCPTIRQDPEIYFDWGLDGPWDTFRKDDFMIIWTRSVYFEGGTYRFTVDVDDGVKVLIDGASVIEEWYDTNGRVFHRDYEVSQGTHKVEVWYYEALKEARIKFDWTKLD